MIRIIKMDKKCTKHSKQKWSPLLVGYLMPSDTYLAGKEVCQVLCDHAVPTGMVKFTRTDGW